MSKNKSNIDDILFKPLLAKNSEEEHIFIIYNTEVISSKALSIKGKVTTSNIIVASLLNITATISSGQAMVNEWTISDIKKFKDSFVDIDPSEYENEVNVAMMILRNEMSMIASNLQNLSKALTTLSFVSGDRKEGNLVIAGENKGFAHVVFKTISGDIANLEKEDIEKMGGVIMDIITSHLGDNLDDQEKIRKLKAEIEYKLIEALPHGLQADDININMESLIEEIKKYRGTTENEEEDN